MNKKIKKKLFLLLDVLTDEMDDIQYFECNIYKSKKKLI